MRWRFADLPIPTKFLITLGIPVLGMVLLIGKQVDSSIKRRDVLQYIRDQSARIALLSEVVHALQHEQLMSVGALCGLQVRPMELELMASRTDEALRAVRSAVRPEVGATREPAGLAGLQVLRQRVAERRIGPREAANEYQGLVEGWLDELGRQGKVALDPETKDRFYAHLSLLNAKLWMGRIGAGLTVALSQGALTPGMESSLAASTAQYQTNILLFERDAPPDVLTAFQEMGHEGAMALVGSMISSIPEKRGEVLPDLPPGRWWALVDEVLDGMREVEVTSMHRIIEGTSANLRDAERRLFIVIAALLGVIAAVAVMALVMLKGIRRTVDDVRAAAQTLANGDLRANVPVTSNDEAGDMARTFNLMIDNLRSHAAAAEAIGKGNYDTEVIVRGKQDVLGTALARMKANLKAARIRNEEQQLALKAEKRKLEKANEHIEVLIREIHHRVKNNLQVIASLLRLQSGNIEDDRLRDLFDQSQNRVTSMALIHEKLYKGDELARLDLAAYLEELFSELVRVNDVRESISYGTEIDPGLTLELNTMVPLGLILNELITNSFKHAFRERDKGHIELAIHQVGEKEFDMRYVDDGVGMSMEKLGEDNDTLGVSLIESLVEQLNGFMTVEGGSEGTAYHIRFRSR